MSFSTVDCETTYDETVRGFAGTQKNPVTVASEEYVLCEGDSKRDMLMHQFAKSIYLIGASSIDNQFRLGFSHQVLQVVLFKIKVNNP